MKIIASLAIYLLLINPINSLAFQNRRPRVKRSSSVPARARVRKDPAQELREKTFQVVWQTVNDENFDPSFGGIDWMAVRSRYAPLVARVRTDRELYFLLRQMLSEIPQSHFAIIPPDTIPRIKPKKVRQGKTAGSNEKDEDGEAGPGDDESESDNEIATQMLNGIDVDVRILGGQVVITRVAEGGPAAKAGLRPGFVIKSIDNMPLDGIPPGIDLSPILHMRLRHTILTDYLGGEPGTDVQLVYLDADNKPQQAVIKRERLKGNLSQPVGNLPPLYTELEARRLSDKIGYIRFTAFTPPLAEKICETIRSMSDAPGIIIDLRGNPGGVMGMISGIVGLLMNRTGLIGTIRTRSGGLPIPAFPQRASYSGSLVILIDRLSVSSSEVMAAALQESGRAVVVGERSAGQVLGANILKLPTGALFEYPRAGFKTSSGVTLEGKGVTPDVEKKLDRALLLKGEDNQLEEAIRQIKTRADAANKKETTASPTPPSPAPVPEISVVTDAGSGRSATAKSAGQPSGASAFKSTPQAEMIMERYIKAVGGREAIEGLKNRASVGVCTFPFQGLTGQVTIYEQAPYKRSIEIDIPNLGVMREVFDGKRGWVQNSMMGYYEYKEPALSLLRREFDFYKITKYRELYSEIIYKGAFDSAQGRVEVLQVSYPGGYRDELHFDAKTGLLVYGEGMRLGDYRQVDGVKLPFLMTMFVAGLEIKIQLEKVSHNVEIGAEAFAEPRSCFTGQ
jgi:carboxyl-terminal processing protease